MKINSKVMYEVCAKYGFVEYQVTAETFENLVIKHPHGFELLIKKSEVSHRIIDGTRFLWQKVHAVERFRRTIDAEAKKLADFQTQLLML